MLLLALFASVPFALAQGTKPKKGAKPDASASASVSAAAPSTADAAPTPAPTDSASAAPSSTALPTTVADATPDKNDPSNTYEDPNQRYYFVGLRYRLAIVPQAFESLFVDDGSTFVSHAIGVELDIRKDGHSTIPWFQWQELSFGDTLFHQKSKPNDTGDKTDVSSGVSLLILGLDQLWSIPMVENKLDYELGFGVGIAFVLGDLHNDWVYDDPNGPLSDSNGHYSACPAGSNNDPSKPTCNPAAHQNSQQIKVGNYVEPNWFNGGSIPQPFFHLALQPVGIRYKPVKFLQFRFGVGLQITGVFFNFALDYGLEQQLNKKGPSNARIGMPGGML